MKVSKLHHEDKRVMIAFIDYVRLSKHTNVRIEILARHLASYLNINPDQSNPKIANKFASLLESGKVS